MKFTHVEKWIEENHPDYKDWYLETMAREYQITEGYEAIKEKVEEILEGTWGDFRDVDEDEIPDQIQSVKPPKGFIYIVLVNGSERVGINIPNTVSFQCE